MEQIFVMPEPGIVVLAGVAMAFKFEFVAVRVMRFEQRIPLWHPLKVIIALALFYAPLLFANWDGLDTVEIAGRIIAYTLCLFVAVIFGSLCD